LCSCVDKKTNKQLQAGQRTSYKVAAKLSRSKFIAGLAARLFPAGYTYVWQAYQGEEVYITKTTVAFLLTTLTSDQGYRVNDVPSCVDILLQ